MPSHYLLLGSEREHPVQSVEAGSVAPDKDITITLLLRRRQEPDADTVHARLSPDQLEQLHGAAPADIEAVKQFAAEHQFTIVEAQPAARTVTISGPSSTLAGIFGADLRLSRLQSGTFRTRQGSLYLPESLAERVVGVFGFDERPVAATSWRWNELKATPAFFTPPAIAKLYDFPSNTGAGQTIALIELGGGYKESDLEAYWKQLGLGNVHVTSVAVDQGSNAPTGNPNSADGEVVLDIEVAGAVAPGASIAVYFAPNTDAGFLAAINGAIHDADRKPSVISISWGAAESEWNGQTMNAFDAAFHDAALLGITVCVASGDNGSSDGEKDRKNHVDFPASSPWVLACGGTRLVGSDGRIQSETVWNDGTVGGATGGGVSLQFALPAYQANAKVPKLRGSDQSTGRGVPDVAGVADPQTGYQVLVDGQMSVVGGTSAVAPLWAGLIALCNEQLGKNLGWFHPVLYGTVAQGRILNDVTSGKNGNFKACGGWDCCTGLGTPNGTALLARLKQIASK